MPTGASNSRNQCSLCNKSFSTSSHLLRHAATHTGQRKTECPFCKKTFSRVDVVRRHIGTCAPVSSRDVVLPTAKRGKRPKACAACRQMKMSCDLANPCTRCRRRGTPCSYNPSERDASAASEIHVAGNEHSHPEGRANPTFGDPAPCSSLDFLLRFTDPRTNYNAEAVLTDFMAQENSDPHQNPLFFDQNRDPTTFATEVDLSSAQWSFNMPDFGSDTGEGDPTCRSQIQCDPDRMDLRVREMIPELATTHHALSTNSNRENKETFDWQLAASVFTADNLQKFVRQYFHQVHVYNSILQPNNFNCETVELRLLLAVFLFGSLVSPPDDSAMSARAFFDIAEEYIFSHAVFDSSFRKYNQDNQRLPFSEAEIEILQAAEIIQILQSSRNHQETRRRIRVERHPRLIEAVRQSGSLQHRRSRNACDFKEHLRDDSLVRLAIWMFLYDVYLTVFFNHAPQIALSELTGDLPDWEDTENEDSLGGSGLSGSSNEESSRPRSVMDFVLSLFHDSWPEPRDNPYGHTSSSSQLLVVAFALLSIVSITRKNCLAGPALDTLFRATERWQKIWILVVDKEKANQHQLRGFARHATGMVSLARMILRAAQRGDMSCTYTRNEVTDSQKGIHDFIHRYKAEA